MSTPTPGQEAEPLDLFLHFLMFCLIAVGGIGTVIPDIHRYLVESNGWMTSREFLDAYTLGQVAPGLNVMYLPLIGWQLAGIPGALAISFAVMFFPATLTMAVARVRAIAPDAAAGRALRDGLSPLTIGFILSTGWLLVNNSGHEWRGHVLTAIAVVITLRSRINPMWLMAAGAVLGLLGVVG